MNALADNQHLSDERYARTKEENAALQARVHMLEEQLRDTELRCEERLASEERRHRELVTRVDREKQLHIDNCAIRLVGCGVYRSLLSNAPIMCIYVKYTSGLLARFRNTGQDKDLFIVSIGDVFSNISG